MAWNDVEKMREDDAMTPTNGGRMFCPQCGAGVTIVSRFCSQCGTMLGKTTQGGAKPRQGGQNTGRRKGTSGVQLSNLLRVVAAGLVVVIAVVGIFIYMENKPLSNGMTKEEGEAVLEEGKYLYNAGDYESALECFVQLPADSKQYEEALSMIAKCESKCRDMAIAEAEAFVSNADYPSAIKVLNQASALIGQDGALAELRQMYIKQYKNMMIAKADDALEKVGYQNAIAVMNEGLKVLDGDSDFQNKLEEYKSYAPVFLSPKDAYAVNKYMNTKVSNENLLTDNYGTTYTPERVISNRSYTGYSDAGCIEYHLNAQYRTLTGILYVPDVSKSIQNPHKLPYVQIWGDGVLLFEIKSFMYKDKPMELCVDVSNVEFVEIRMYGGWFRGDGSGLIPVNCIADLAVAK